MKQSERDTQDTCEHCGNEGSDIITCSSCRGQPNEIANTALRELLNG